MLSVLLLSGGRLRAQAEPPFGVRSLPCRVVDEWGRPVAGVRVFLGGLERSSVDPEELAEKPDRYPELVFLTDDRGCFTARFGKFNPYQQEDRGGFNGPGYGKFHFFLSKPGWAGGVSRLVVNAERPEDDVQPDPRKTVGNPLDRGEWQRGEYAPLILADNCPAKPLDIVLKRGLEVTGRLVDGRGRPLPNRKLSVSLDLHHGSHTGAGGEIFGQEATTDLSGRFHFHHVYPNVFRLWLTWTDPSLHWFKTQVRGRWFDGIVDYMVPRTDGKERPTSYEREISVRLMASDRMPYRYFGKVTDLDKHPVAGATVSVQTSRHDPSLNYGDDHGTPEIATTDEQGMYSLRTETPFANWIVAEATGGKGQVPTRGDMPIPPGRHDIMIGSPGVKQTSQTRQLAEN